MKKQFLFSILFLTLFGTTYAQDFYFGLSSGFMKSVYSKTEQNNYIKDGINYLPSAAFTFSVIFKNNIELETGIMYYPYPHNIRFRWDTIGAPNPMKGYHGLNDIAYHAFSLPIHFGYKFKLANRLYANIHSGLNFDFYFEELRGFAIGSIGDSDIYISSEEGALKQHFNILFANKISLQYFTKFNMGISLYAAYHAGLLQVWESFASVSYYGGVKKIQSTFLSRGSFWNFGIELGYKLDKKQRKSAKSVPSEF